MTEQRLGMYRLLHRLGTGGMGTVWLARSLPGGPLPADAEVAVKVVKCATAADRIRFTRESRYLQGLHHPGIVRVLDTGDDGEQAWLVMARIAGQRLDELGIMGASRAADLVVQALEALHVAHLAGILHRDIKPSNLMLDHEGRVVLLDFGLAAAPDLESRLTRDGDVVGTPAYMAPEQAAGRRDEIGRRSDLYAMGAVLYELVTGRQPFVGETTMATLRAVLEDPLLPPRRLRPDLPKPLERIILTAMARDAGDRYRTAEDMAADLRRWLGGRPVRGRPPGRIRLTLRAAYRQRRLVAALGLVGFLTLAGSALALRAWVRAPATPLAPTAWVLEQRLEGQGLTWEHQAHLGGDRAELARIAGPVRLSITTPAPPLGGWCELLVADRDFARGYRLRLEPNRLMLLREDRMMVQERIEPLAPPQVVTLTLQQEDGVLRGEVVGTALRAELSFDDLVPLQGPDTDGVWVAVSGPMARPTEVVVERRQTSEFVSALARADMLRQNGSWVRAQALYERFLRDQPNSPQARDARLRLALCLEAQGDRQRALTEFQALAGDQDPRYALTATFHAWACSLALGRFREAEQLFTRIRRSYELPALAATIPAATLRDLLRDYLEQGTAQAAAEPERGVTLFFTAAELAGFLEEPERQMQALTAAGDLLLALDQPVAARETWRRALLDQRLGREGRFQLLLRLGATGRLTNDLEGAAIALAQAASLTSTDEDLHRLAFWQGELLAARGETVQAFLVWRSAAQDQSPLGRLLASLADLQPIDAGNGDVGAADDGPWIAARIAELRGRSVDARPWLERSGQRLLVWPGALARQVLQSTADLRSAP